MKARNRAAMIWQMGIREGAWLTWDRIGFACLCSAIGLSLGLIWLLVVPNAFGAPNGTVLMDYFSFWLAGRQALAGVPEIVYVPAEFSALQVEISGSETVFGFFYPPTFQLLLSVFAALPYKIAFAAFVISTTALLCLSCRLITGKWLLAACLILIPACANNAFHGQNAALTAALYGFFLVGIERQRMMLAGFALGLLTIKPQLGILVPVALVASLNWRAFLGASVTTLVFAGLSAAVLGAGVWLMFWQQAPVAAAMMELGGVEWGKMISVYGSFRQFGLGHEISMAAQMLVGLGALICVWKTWRRTGDMAVRSASLIGGTLLVTPFALTYDLTLLVIPCAFLIREGLDRGFFPYDRILLAVVIGLSASTAPFAILLGIPMAPLVPAAILFLGMRRMQLIDRARQREREPDHISGTASA
ncbi:MAG: glycosyltransferase family 87 protein [Roseibium album]|uniref:glycosyltransferase family 87 protein n=1 Tax=Roseibium album TaxID=311410 RepID=UPI0032ED2B6F